MKLTGGPASGAGDAASTTAPPVGGPEVGIVAWFHVGDEGHVRRTVADVDALGIRRLRTGFSWADYERGDLDGPAWFDFVVREQLGDRIAAGELDVLFNFLYTPWKRARVNKHGLRTTASPPRILRWYGDFVGRMIARYGELIGDVELMNEMDISPEWDRELDWEWHKLARTLRHAAALAHRRGRRTVLGGGTRVEPVLFDRLNGSRWLGRSALRHIDVVGLHGFPGTWDTSVTHASDWRWRGWHAEVALARRALHGLGLERPLWVTETGSSTFDDPSGASQLSAFRKTYAELTELGVERVYWYGLHNLGEDRATINNVITGESRESNPHSHTLGMKEPLRAHLAAWARTYFTPREQRNGRQ
jgi:CDP-paratose 2-epimerase